MNIIRVVGLVGVKGSGKTKRQQDLVAQGYVALDFKDALLDMASDLVGYDVRANYDYFKENLVGLSAPAEIGPALMQRRPPHQITAEVLASYPLAMTGRLLLQRLGTEVMRKRNANYWADAWYDKAHSALYAGQRVVVADCRFPNEIRMMRQLASDFHTQAQFIFCDYRSARYCATDPHESEHLAQHYLAQGYKDGEEVQVI